MVSALSALSQYITAQADEGAGSTNIIGRFSLHIMLSAMAYTDELVKQCQDITCADKISCVHLGMGATGIWRGEPDCRLRGITATSHDVAGCIGETIAKTFLPIQQL